MAINSSGRLSRPVAEFTGPFASWTHVTAYGAIGDGKADDTAAIQRGLDELSSPNHSPVLYFPSGKYRITKTLNLSFNLNLSIIGENPENTLIVWDGPPGGTMLVINGIAYSRFSRLTFDGGRQASVAIEQSWEGSRGHFDTGNEYSDNVFRHVEYGIHGGFKGHGFAETSIVRSRFLRNTRAGVALGNFNALDIWVWDSVFDYCGVGVTNATGAGNFHVYNSTFRNSTVADLQMQNTGGFSARENYSKDSRAFFISMGPTANPATIDIQNNRIVDPVDSAAIRFSNEGPGLVVDNVIQSRPETRGPVLSWASLSPVDVAAIGNTFTATNPIRVEGRLTDVDNRVVPRASLHLQEPLLAVTPPSQKRTVIEVPTKADTAAIQSAIDRAVALKEIRPIVHIPFGTYAITQTLSLPASDLELSGDGGGTVLRWAGPDRGPVIKVKGPSRAVIQDLLVDGAKAAEGIVVENVDQQGGRVHLEGVQLSYGMLTNLFVDGLDHARVQLFDVGHMGSAGASIKVIGGPLSAAGTATSTETRIYSGASSDNRPSYEVSNGGRLFVRDSWYESGSITEFANIHDRAIFMIQGSRVATLPGRVAAFNVSDLIGQLILLTTDIDDRIDVSGKGQNAEVSSLGLFRERRPGPYYNNSASPPARTAFLHSRQRAEESTRSMPFENAGGPMEPDTLRRMLVGVRGFDTSPRSIVPTGATDLRMFRVFLTNGLHNLRLVASVL
jgi:hypothetical protein